MFGLLARQHIFGVHEGELTDIRVRIFLDLFQIGGCFIVQNVQFWLVASTPETFMDPSPNRV